MKKGEFTFVKGLYAFWRYDQFPYLLGGPIRCMAKSGSVQCENYNGSWFTPLFIVPLAQGKEMHHKLKELEAEYGRAQKNLREEFMKKALAITLFADPRNRTT